MDLHQGFRCEFSQTPVYSDFGHRVHSSLLRNCLEDLMRCSRTVIDDLPHLLWLECWLLIAWLQLILIIMAWWALTFNTSVKFVFTFLYFSLFSKICFCSTILEIVRKSPFSTSLLFARTSSALSLLSLIVILAFYLSRLKVFNLCTSRGPAPRQICSSFEWSQHSRCGGKSRSQLEATPCKCKC